MMNPSDISNALIYGIPIISCIGYGYESLMACRGRLVGSEGWNDGTWESALATRPNKLRLAVAESRDQIAAARALVSRRYAWRGYHGSNGDEHPSAADRSTHEVTFIVEDGKAIVGTVTLGLDGPNGLLAELTYNTAIAKIRGAGRRVCELTRLAISESADSKSVLASLLGLSHFVVRMHHVSDVFIEVNPRHVSFYSRVLGFIVAGTEKICERVSAPSVLLRLELDQLEGRFKNIGMGQLLPPPWAEAA